MVWACIVKKRWWPGEEMHGVWSRGPQTKRKTKENLETREVVEKDGQAHKLKKEDAVDRSKWKKLIKDVQWSGWVWVGECSFWYRPTPVVPNERLLNGCVCSCTPHSTWLLKIRWFLEPTWICPSLVATWMVSHFGGLTGVPNSHTDDETCNICSKKPYLFETRNAA